MNDPIGELILNAGLLFMVYLMVATPLAIIYLTVVDSLCWRIK